MDFRKMTYFEAVCRLQSFTKASEELHVTQPSVTMAVQSLEEDLGVRLLNRYRGGLVLTPEGELLFEKTKYLIKELEDVEQELRSFISGRTETLRVGYSVQMRKALSPILEQFQFGHREIHIIENESSTPSIATQLQDGMIDFGIVTATKAMSKVLEICPLFQGEVRVCVSNQNPLSQKGSVTLEEFEQQQLIALSLNEPKNSYIFQVLQEAYPNRRIQIKPQFSTLMLNTFFQHIKANEGIGLTYYDRWFSSEQYEKDLGAPSTYSELPFEPPCHYTVALVYQKGKRLTGAGKIFSEFLQDTL